MCRLFGLLSTRDESAEPWLLRSDRSLFVQSNVAPDRAQKDGWGVGWFENGGRARVEKGTGGAYEATERDRYVKAARDARGPLILGHLRHASNPLNLPQEKLIALENSQPFESHTTLFAHNGSIPFPTETRPLLGSMSRRYAESTTARSCSGCWCGTPKRPGTPWWDISGPSRTSCEAGKG